MAVFEDRDVAEPHLAVGDVRENLATALEDGADIVELIRRRVELNRDAEVEDLDASDVAKGPRACAGRGREHQHRDRAQGAQSSERPSGLISSGS